MTSPSRAKVRITRAALEARLNANSEKKLNIMVDWSDERIAALSDQDLKNLLANAERKSVAEVVAQCKAEMEKRDAAKPRKASKPRTELKEFEHDMSAQLAAVGKEMAGKYDLSEVTAKANSVGVKGFKSHKLLDAKGYAKLGGMQRDGSVAVDRYISYRRGKDIVSLSVFLLKDQPIEAHEFHVIAPKALLDGAKKVSEIRPTATEAQKQSADSGLSFKDLPSAAAAFDKALAKVTA
jgi:ribosomal protein L12E/L44/L45/RPP1/RPP2